MAFACVCGSCCLGETRSSRLCARQTNTLTVPWLSLDWVKCGTLFCAVVFSDWACDRFLANIKTESLIIFWWSVIFLCAKQCLILLYYPSIRLSLCFYICIRLFGRSLLSFWLQKINKNEPFKCSAARSACKCNILVELGLAHGLCRIDSRSETQIMIMANGKRRRTHKPNERTHIKRNYLFIRIY